MTRQILLVQPGGLSPRTRGNLAIVYRERAGRWTIPAHAGEPSSNSGAVWQSQDYPRARGGTAGAAVTKATALGLSPRTRGNL
ncbi:Hypothetical protein GbCGDNIH5_8158 [Granulibacter bethesdensis]|nr:Hypothetical protein GbCGDNIH5_8158 [Granulibacter bethesdensis]